MSACREKKTLVLKIKVSSFTRTGKVITAKTTNEKNGFYGKYCSEEKLLVTRM